MRLTYNSIRKVVELTSDGVSYCWLVFSRSGNIGDAREYANYNQYGRTTIEPYPAERLPKTVQKFIAGHRPILKDFIEQDDFASYEYK